MTRVAWKIVLSLAALKFALQLHASGSYGYFRDELYYIACGRHLDWGYVDHPPLGPLMARLGEAFGSSLRAFRLPVTLAGTLRIVLTGVLTARLGGGRMAQALACTAVLLAPIYLGIDSILSMNPFEHLFWLVCILAVTELANGGSEKWWLVFGVSAGFALQTKHSILFLAFAVAIGLLLTPLRRSLLRPWIWIGGALAALIFLPNLLWQIAHDFPTLELLRNVKETGKNVVLSPVEFMLQQTMMLDPFAAPVWVAGVLALFAGAKYRVLGWTYAVVLVTFIALEGKDYYVAPVYPMLFAAGAVWLAQRRWMAVAAFALVIVGGLIAAPLALPLLPPDRYLAYQRALGVEPARAEVSHDAPMPQIFADQFGWEEMVREVARVYHALPPEQRANTAIWGANYGEAAAIDFYGPKYDLPRAISGHQNYYLWGPRHYTGQSMILIASGIRRTRPLYATLQIVGQRHHPHAMPEENGPIFLARTKRPLREIWPHYKNWR